MASSQSLKLSARTDSFAAMFIKSQFRSRPKHLPQDLDLSGRVAIITGATTGLGTECARQLLSYHLSHLILAVRSVDKGKTTAGQLHSKFPGVKVDVWALEMTSYDSIQSFARRVNTELTRLDIVILNAGLLKMHFGLVESTGHEEVIQVNYLSTAFLAILLLPALKAKSPSPNPGRLTIVGSGMALVAKLTNRHQVPFLRSFDDTKLQKYNISDRYESSKALGHLFLTKLIEYVKADDVVVNIVDPGLCKGTGLHRDLGALENIIGVAKSITGRTLEAGASTYVDAAAVRGKESHGCFLMDWEIRP